MDVTDRTADRSHAYPRPRHSSEDGERQLSALIDSYLQEQRPGAGPAWIDDGITEAGRAAGVDFLEQDRDLILAELQRHKPKPRVNRLVEATLAEVAKTLNPSEQDLVKLRHRLANNGHIRRLVRQS